LNYKLLKSYNGIRLQRAVFLRHGFGLAGDLLMRYYLNITPLFQRQVVKTVASWLLAQAVASLMA
jgi:hypothetical protein